jgi:hypothetical protein
LRHRTENFAEANASDLRRPIAKTASASAAPTNRAEFSFAGLKLRDSYCAMNRMVLIALLALGGLLLLNGCALDDDDDLSPNRPAAAEETPVAGTTPGPSDNSSAGLKW